jgi:hypothetical protein
MQMALVAGTKLSKSNLWLIVEIFDNRYRTFKFSPSDMKKTRASQKFVLATRVSFFYFLLTHKFSEANQTLLQNVIIQINSASLLLHMF